MNAGLHGIQVTQLLAPTGPGVLSISWNSRVLLNLKCYSLDGNCVFWPVSLVCSDSAAAISTHHQGLGENNLFLAKTRKQIKKLSQPSRLPHLCVPFRKQVTLSGGRGTYCCWEGIYILLCLSTKLSYLKIVWVSNSKVQPGGDKNPLQTLLGCCPRKGTVAQRQWVMECTLSW